MKSIYILFGIGLTLSSGISMAATSCTELVSGVHIGSAGNAWLYLSQDGKTTYGSGYIAPNASTDPTNTVAKTVIGLGTVAMITGQPVTVTYSATGVPCDSIGRSDIQGVSLVPPVSAGTVLTP